MTHSRKHRSRHAASVAEVVVATAILTIAMTGVGRFAYNIKQGLRTRELSSRMDLEINNLREEVGSWKVEDISSQRIEAIPISDNLQTYLEQPRWEAQVVTLSKPVEAVQVTLSLHCQIEGQRAKPATRTFWIVDQSAAEMRIDNGDGDE
jgi:hypothetical protein